MKKVYISLIIVSASIICFEIVSTRISSVIFVNNYAFIILALAILGLGTGGIFSYYKINPKPSVAFTKTIRRIINLLSLSFVLFGVVTTGLKATNPIIYFFFLFLPFFFAGIIYAQLFKEYAEQSFKLYASDLTGAALGAVLSIFIFDVFNAANAVLLFAVVMFYTALSFLSVNSGKKMINTFYAVLTLALVILIIYGKSNFLGQVPIGKYQEKDFYYVYPDAENKSKIIDSRWSIYGRSDLVEYSHQDMVKQLFIDGAAGTQMYRFNGDVKNPSQLLYNLIIRHSTSIPFKYLREHEKDRMLVIGPGGGKEVLTGLLAGVKSITGVEVNPDFVEIVKDYRKYNGGIYTDFPNVRIEVKEGRHYIKKTNQLYDLIVMALPSTEQLQSIDNFAMNENYLLSVEAIQDYLKILTPEGRMIFTVHNRWELIRLIVTAFYAFEVNGINNQNALNHMMLLSDDYAPTIVIKKNEYTMGDIAYINNVSMNMSKELPSITYMPYRWDKISNTIENKLLKTINEGKLSLQQYVNKDKYDISAVWDDSPYFYKVFRGVPEDYSVLAAGVLLLSALVTILPYLRIRRKLAESQIKLLIYPLIVFLCIGLGFMILEVSLFQKLILYLGSPTISLSVLLASILIGMGIGSYKGDKLISGSIESRIRTASLLIAIMGCIIFIIYPLILNWMLMFGQVLRSVVTFFLILPLGFLLGIPFPSAIQYLKHNKLEKFIPWMYGVNGIMSVLGSVLAVVLSMLFGFTPAFFIGLSIYLLLYLLSMKLGTH